MDPTVRLNVRMKANSRSAIGELARRFGLAAHVLRHWESMGLLEPARDGIGQRTYGEADALEDRIAKATSAKLFIEHALSCPTPFDQCPHAKEQIAARIPPLKSRTEH